MDALVVAVLWVDGGDKVPERVSFRCARGGQLRVGGQSSLGRWSRWLSWYAGVAAVDGGCSGGSPASPVVLVLVVFVGREGGMISAFGVPGEVR